jgi:hypothetical protein
VNAESRTYLVASCSIGLGVVCGAGVLLLTTLAWASLASEPQLPTVLFFVAMLLLAYGCHKLDCLEEEQRRQ